VTEAEGSQRPPELGDMPPEELHRHALEVADWIADYLRDVGEAPVFPDVAPGVLNDLPGVTEEGEPFETILRDFRERIVPATTHWNHPRFHAYFAVTGSAPGILGETLAAALNVNAMVWRSGPAATELEEQTLAHLRDLLGLPEAFRGAINDTASTSTLYALAAARHSAMPTAAEQGMAGLPPGRVYASEQAHSSVDKAVLTLGFGRAGMVHVPTDERLCMDPAALREAIRRDREAGRTPVAIVATLGTTSTTALDPVGEIARIAAEEGVWLHVDAAYGGPLALLDEWRLRMAGWEQADSIVVNPHKWLFTPIDCSVLWVRGVERLAAAFSLTPEYLKTTEGTEATNLMDYGVALGRRFRSLKLWFVLRYFGRAGLERRIREHIRIAEEIADTIATTPGWEVHTAGEMALVVFRAVDPDGLEPSNRLNEDLLERVARSGEALLSHTRLEGVVWLRLAVGNVKTRGEDVAQSWEAVRAARRRAEGAIRGDSLIGR